MKGIRSNIPIALVCGASTVLAGALAPRASLAPVTVKGNGKQNCRFHRLVGTFLFYSDNLSAFFAGNDRFYIRGIDYQPGGSSDAADPLANTDTCKRDIAE